MKQIFGNLVAIAVILCAESLTGCKDPYRATQQASADIATGVTQGNSTVDQLRIDGLISPAEEADSLGYLKFVNDANGAFSRCATAVHQHQGPSVSFTSCAQTFQTALQNPQEEALLHVTNPSAQQRIDLIAGAFVSAASTLIAALGGQ